MNALRIIVWIAAINIFCLCAFAAIEWQFAETNKKLALINPFAVYFLAKGIFCSLSLVLSLRIIEILSRMARYSTPPDELEE
jgi:hypothetical protein